MFKCIFYSYTTCHLNNRGIQQNSGEQWELFNKISIVEFML